MIACTCQGIVHHVNGEETLDYNARMVASWTILSMNLFGQNSYANSVCVR